MKKEPKSLPPHAPSAPLFPYILLRGLVGEVSLALWLTIFGVNARG